MGLTISILGPKSFGCPAPGHKGNAEEEWTSKAINAASEQEGSQQNPSHNGLGSIQVGPATQEVGESQAGKAWFKVSWELANERKRQGQQGWSRRSLGVVVLHPVA